MDVANPHAFGRTDDFGSDLALGVDDLPVFGDLITQLEACRAADFESRFIAETPAKLRRLQQYFAAVQGRAPYPAVRCNAPEFSAVVGVKGAVQPCFFIAGPAPAMDRAANDSDLESVLNRPAMVELRERIRAGERPECVGCVCSLYREPDNMDELLLP